MINPSQNELIQGSHCSYCGTRFTEQNSWPRKCFRCYNESYKNPIPIVVMMVPVYLDRIGGHVKCGYLIQQRNIPPGKGGWAFPSGYINFGETWQQAAVRELQEEVGLTLAEEDLLVFKVINAESGNMLIFCTSCQVYRDEINFIPNDEVLAIDTPILPGDVELCFPTHNQMWADYYNGLGP
jgi:ADP-ribose pyrophosphatase YjhB (NUDIX family)